MNASWSFGVIALAVTTLVAAVIDACRHFGLRRDARRRCVALGDRTTSTSSLADRVGHWWQQRRRVGHRSHATSLAVLLDDIARRSTSGHSLTAAFVAGAAAHPTVVEIDEIGRAVERLRSGSGLDDAFATADSMDADLTLAIHVLRLCAVQGGDVAESLDRAAATLRERQAAHDERLAQSGQARLSAKVLTILPMAFASWTMVTNASVQRFVVSPIGLVCVAIGVGLNLAGWSLMRRAIEGDR